MSSPEAHLAVCPYCGVPLDPPPTATRKCPACRNKVVRRKRGSSIRFLTEDQAKEYDAERHSEATRNKALRRTVAIGLEESDFQRAEQELAQSQGYSPAPRDVFWRLANQRIVQLGDPRRYGYDLDMVYREMALLLCDENQPWQQMLRQANKSRLIWERANTESVVGRTEAAYWRAVIMANACCPECATLDGKTYTFQEAIDTGPMPPEDCSAGWCNCCWSTLPPDDDTDWKTDYDEARPPAPPPPLAKPTLIISTSAGEDEPPPAEPRPRKRRWLGRSD